MSRNPQRERRNMPRFPHFLPLTNQHLTTKIATTISLALILSTPLFSQISIDNLKQNFQNPPADTKPMMRWWWFGTSVEKPEILRELQQMKADGIGGVELAFVYPQVLDAPAKGLINDPFLSPAMLGNVRYAQSEARKLGLRVDVTLGSGWPYGGPATTLEEAASRLRVVEIAIPPQKASISYPELVEGEKLLYAAIVKGEPKLWDASTAQPMPELIAGVCCPPPIEQFGPSDTPRTVLFFIASHTRQQVKRAAVGAEGWVLDPFSHQAVATHLEAVGEPLVKAFGPTPPYAVFSDSLEAYGADWTTNLPAEFRKRRGYDLLPHLPELVAGGTPEAAKIRHDWGKTLTELVNKNYLTQIDNWAIAHHTKFRSQTYGEPAVSLSSQRLVALPEGEGPRWREFSTLRWASSANHLFGNNVTSAETFTWLHSPVFRATPLDMKAEADLHFIIGTNQIIGHGWPYSPPQVGEPGWSLYAAAVFNDNNPWHPVMPDVTRYIQRISYLLRQGQPANQVAVLLPTDDAWANFSPGKVTVTGEMAHLITPALMSAILSAGYNVDFIDADAINSVGFGTHQILVLPPTERIPLETLRKIHVFAENGGKVLVVGHSPTIDPEGKSSPELTELSKAMAAVPNTGELTKALDNVGNPDLKLTNADDHTKEVVGFIRRKLRTADIYFVVNTSNHPIDIASATFGTSFKSGQAWDPDSAASFPANPTSQPIHLAPYESRIFVFSNSKSATPFLDCCPERTDFSTGWKVNFVSKNKTLTEATLTDWTADPATKFYSGEVAYTRDFKLDFAPKGKTFLAIEGGTPTDPNPPITQQAEKAEGIRNPLITRPGPGMRAWYDPPIREAAIVYINGQRAGSLWHPPYQLDVSKFLLSGQNHIEIRVFNTAINAWAALPPHDYKPLIAKYGDRFQMQDLDKVEPQPSGILGSIHLIITDSR
jgi:alpha-L-rhamnosidase